MVEHPEHAGEDKRGIPVPLGEPSVVVDHASQVYRTQTTNREMLGGAGALGRAAHRLFRTPFSVEVHAVRDVSFFVRSGESVGVLGLNGSGKSTLLRMIAGVESPAAGRVFARSQPTLLGVGAALVPDLTGIRNIRLGCLAMGLTPAEAKEITPAIVELAGIGDSIFRPMRTYSSGMGARLRFAINAAVHPEILLIDEALGTGDASFKKRSERILASIRESAGTVFLVSHAAQVIEQLCTRAIWMHEGRLVADGPAWETARAYRLWAWKLAEGEQDEAERLFKKATGEFAPRPLALLESPRSRRSGRRG
ncbi:ABC transporter ATP-binding protein [Schaalia hyovaginalis]|uniref:ABC transporter ATP-binding protein n=1 Tax=Schaalia hyovaginalis TaxID=29316 RepID=UPI002A80C5C9|nr:ABC transporter ATP-binding protein [Schaalia hyovaginalis]MDY3665754.1 ABC transporter ATP-binding protein [Schaalia hyovaginalis]